MSIELLRQGHLMLRFYKQSILGLKGQNSSMVKVLIEVMMKILFDE